MELTAPSTGQSSETLLVLGLQRRFGMRQELVKVTALKPSRRQVDVDAASCYTVLGRPSLAAKFLEAALADDLSPRRRGPRRGCCDDCIHERRDDQQGNPAR
jgi:hypothetical protein